MFKDKFNTLTEQEKAICKKLLQLKSTNEIADELFLSPTTVRTHYVNLFQKLEIFGNDRKAQLVEMYYKEQLWNYQVALQSLEESLTVFKALTKSRLTFSNLETKYLENIESAINDTKKTPFFANS